MHLTQVWYQQTPWKSGTKTAHTECKKQKQALELRVLEYYFQIRWKLRPKPFGLNWRGCSRSWNPRISMILKSSAWRNGEKSLQKCSLTFTNVWHLWCVQRCSCIQLRHTAINMWGKPCILWHSPQNLFWLVTESWPPALTSCSRKIHWMPHLKFI